MLDWIDSSTLLAIAISLDMTKIDTIQESFGIVTF